MYETTDRQIVVMDGLGGRFDQAMCNLNALYHYPNTRIYLLSHFSVCFLLPPGKHIIQRNTKFEREKCGIVPLGRPCNHITTKGLKWDLKDDCLQFGALISTSNIMLEDQVFVENSDPVVWTTNLKLDGES